jgi:signal peptidase I
VEGPDECGHRGEIDNKVLSIELIDQKILKPVYEYLVNCGDDFKILVLPDHPTPIEIRTHSSDPVPFMLYDSKKEHSGVVGFDEQSARNTGIVVEHGHNLLDSVINKYDHQDTIQKNAAKKAGSFASNFFDYLEIFVLSITMVLILFTFCARICRVDGESMKNTFYDGQPLIISNLFYTPDNGDVVVFHQTEKYQKPLVKRIIATGGQKVVLNFEKKTVVITDAAGNAVDYSDKFATFYNRDKTDFGEQYEWRDNLYSDNNPIDAVYDEETGAYTFTVPKGMLFVMGDNRNFSADSRSIGFIDERTVLGKAIVRLKPFTIFTD